MHLQQLSKLTVDQLQAVKAGTLEKIALIDARETGRNADVDAAFARSRAALADQVAMIDSEIGRRS